MAELCIVLLIGLVIAQALVIWGLKQDICELKQQGGDSARVGAAADAINKSTDDLAAAVEKNKL